MADLADLCKHFQGMAKHRIDIQSPTLVSDDFGGATTTFTSLGIFWAAIEPMTGREVFSQGQIQSRVTHKFTIRFTSLISSKTAESAKHRISFDSRLYNVRYIRNIDEMDEFYELFAEEGVAI